MKSPLFIKNKNLVDAKPRIQHMVERELEEGLFLVDVIISGSQSAVSKVLVLVDGDKGITIDTCAKISRNLGAAIEEENLFEGAYLLEVSSPGLDHPLKLERQYKKNIGRKIRVLLEDGRSKEGELLQVNDSGILLGEAVRMKGSKKVEVNKVEIPFSEVEKTNVIISFK